MTEREPPIVRIDLHCHSSISFDGLVEPAELARLAHERGLTHLAVTDHLTVGGGLAARASAPAGLTVIVGQELYTREGDLIALFTEADISPDLTLEASVAMIREQGGVVGLPHPFDSRRRSVGVGVDRPADLRRLALLVDYVEGHNGRVADEAVNARAAEFARRHELPLVAVSDSHKATAIGTAATVLEGPVGSADELLRALRGAVTMTVREPFRAERPRGRVKRWLAGS